MHDWTSEDAEAFFARSRTDDELARLRNEALSVEIHAATLPRIIPRAGAPRAATDPTVTTRSRVRTDPPTHRYVPPGASARR